MRSLVVVVVVVVVVVTDVAVTFDQADVLRPTVEDAVRVNIKASTEYSVDTVVVSRNVQHYYYLMQYSGVVTGINIYMLGADGG